VSNKYDSYKDSGVEWIGDIPSHWDIYKVKNLIDKSLYYQVGDGDHGSIKPEMYQEHGIPYIRVQNLSWSGKLLLDNVVFISEEIQSLNPKSKLLPNDILIAKTGATVGKLGLITNDLTEANTTSSVGKLTVDKKRFNPKYILYSFQADFFQKELWLKACEKSAQPGFNIDDFVLFKIASPQLSEQTNIANFLDHKTTQIDHLIAKKEQFIHLLEEERVAVINQAVTKGLDPNVPMKDSGIEWLGVIPEHWNYSSLKWYSKIYSGGTPSKDVEEYWKNGTIPWLNSGCVNQWDITEVSDYITENAYNNSSAKWIPNKSLVIALAGQGKTKGMIAQVQFETTCNQSLGVIVPNEKINNRFLQYWLKNNYQNIRNLGGGDKRDGLNLVMIGAIPIPVLPLYEQEKIAKYLDSKNTEIDSVKVKMQQEIILLNEYKTALISEVITGKVDVSTGSTQVLETKN